MKRIERKKRCGVVWIGMALLLLGPADILPRAEAIFCPQQKQQRFEFKGVVKSVDRPHRSATIRHEKVGNFMEAMTMPFLIKDAKALQAMQPGDQLIATLVSTSDGAQWLENITILADGQ
jgi:Cu/Ag efflux protein CusF